MLTAKRIIWITGDYFFDVDASVVPYIKEYYNLDIDWYVIKSYNNNIDIPKDGYTKMFYLHHKGKDPRVIFDYMRIFDAIKLNNADLIYSNYVGVPYYYPYLHYYIRKKMPIIHAAHNVIPYKVWPLSLVWYTRYVFRFNKHFQLFSEFTNEYFKKKYPNKSIFYCPMTLKGYGEVSTDNYQIDPEKLNLLFFGNVAGNKRLDLLIDAIKHLPEQIREKVHLTIAGKCNEAQKYMNQIGGCKSISTFFKRIDDDEIAELFNKHDYLMLPYQDVAQSGPHMIAYYYNLPVIASDIDGFSERVIDNQNGLLFKNGDEQKLINVITKASMMKKEDYYTLKTNLKKYAVENFSLEYVSNEYVKYFRHILK
ncbi:MAG: hypothetical protein H6Q13_2635 [Bacteroidetes bacterium]|nr:hypothetical protein [Bacteroidota bacterium]